MLMTWFWLAYCQSLQFGGLLFNTFVHVVMYYYFFLRSRGAKEIWWKPWITRIQIIQFVFSMICVVPWAVLVFGYKRQCSGYHATLFNLGFNASLLFLFIGVLTRIKKDKKKKS
mmetsp:Transcript_4478/g.5952  ORF Transcript_4478/g.5952 Transcript_4478/m.5952 type:complete len:114 (+) Transcript_4478:2-343(+)